MERRREPDGHSVQSESPNAIGEGIVEVLGENPCAGMESVCPETSNLRACDIVRLLNSTPLGEVINERQFHRHRGRAGGQIGGGRRVDLIRYAAWLVGQRHYRSRQIRPRVAGSVTAAEACALVERQQYRCALTGRLLTPKSASLDHVLPICRGGKHGIGNAQVLHKQINRIKGVLTNEEFVAVCREVVEYANGQHEAGQSSKGA